MNGEWPAAVERVMVDMVDTHQLMDGFQGAATPYVATPYEVLQHLLGWVEEYGKRWERGVAG